jgi:hypothetical protein
MPGPLSIALPLVLAAVLIASGVTKLRHPDDLAGWEQLGVPRIFRREWLLRLHPWGELALGGALLALGGVLGMIAALASLGLMAAYLWLVVRAVSRPEDTSCACFGSAKPVTRLTVFRNAWLTALAAAAVAVIWVNPLWGGALAAIRVDDGLWVIAMAVAAVTTALITGSEASAAAAAPTEVVTAGLDGDDDEEGLDYIRLRTPAVPVTLADGSTVNLRTLTAARPILLLAVSETCGPCMSVRDRLDDWRDLLPEVDIRLLLRADPEAAGWTETAEPQSLHDSGDYVRGSIADWATPTAVLLGTDGLLAGGPVSGVDEIAAFVNDVHSTLHPQPMPV